MNLNALLTYFLEIHEHPAILPQNSLVCFRFNCTFAASNNSKMNFPENLKYTKDHEWLRAEGDIAYVGITDFAQSELGDIVYVDINSVGDTVESGAVFGTVEAVKTVSDLFMPVTAQVLEVNPLLDAKPELVNTAPYGDGWMIKIDIKGGLDESDLLSASDYRALIGH